MSVFRREKSAYGAFGLVLGAEDLALINKYTLRMLDAGEVFAFKVTMCDNEIDRDCEAFDAATLEQLGKLYVGRTVIMNHSPKAENQCARIYSAQVLTDDRKKTSYGEPYTKLEACCYMLRSEDTRAQIGLIEAGILKEISVGASVKKEICSICGNSYWSSECTHHLGEKYDQKKCFIRLVDAADAYEISFVAVPAQPAAGVTKESRTEHAEPMRAELLELMGTVKQIALTVSRLEKNAGNTPTDNKTKEIQGDRLDPEIEELIQSANVLIKNIEGEI